MTGYGKRLAWLEDRVFEPVVDHRTFDRADLLNRAAPWLAGWGILRESMTTAHVERIEAAAADFWAFGFMRPGTPSFWTFMPHLGEADPLVRRVNAMIHDARRGKHAGPFVLPEAVADAWQDDPDAGALDDCDGCGYHVPRHRFAACPLCGAALGCLFFYRRHGVFAPRYRLPAEAIDEARHALTPFVDQLLDDAAIRAASEH